MAESFDKNLLDPLIEEIKNPKPLPTSKTKKGGTKKQVSKKTFPGKQFSGKFSSSSGSLGPRVISKIGASFGLAAASRKAFKESGGDPRSLRRGYFLSKALGAEFGGDFRRRTAGTFSRNPDATQDPGMSKEERFAQVVKRDLANRPQMMKQGEILDVDSYTNKTGLQSITDLAKKTADKILGLEPGFVRIEKSQKETSKAFVKITQSLTEVKNTFVKTSDNFKEFVDNKEEVIKIKTKIREVLRKEQDENKTNAAEKQLEMFGDTARTTDVAETDQGLNDEEEQQEDGGGLDLPYFRRRRIRGRLRLLRRRFGRFRGGIGRRLRGVGRNVRGFGGRALGGIKGLGSKIKMPNIGGLGGGVGSKLGLRGAGKIGARLIPGVGTAIGLGMAAESFSKGDVFGGIMGLGSAIPGPIGWGFLAGQLLGEGAKSLASKNKAEYDKKNDPNNVLEGLGFSEGGPKSVMPSDGSIPQIVQRDVPWWEKLNPFKMSEGGIVVGDQRSERKLSSGGIIAGEAGNEAVIPLTSSVGKKVTGGLEENNAASTVSAIGPLLSATAGIVRNPIYGSILGPVVNPIIQPMLAQYKVPVYSGDFGSFKISKLQAATTQAKGKSKSIEQASQNPLTSGMGWLGNMFSGIGGMVSGAFGGIRNFFGGLFGRRRRRGNGGGGGKGGTPGAWGPILDVIKSAEMGRGGYESMNPSTSLPGATNMTIGEVNRRATGAVGAYQFMPRQTLPAAMNGAGLKETDLFSPANQDKMAVWLIENRGVTPQMIKTNPDEAMIRLGMEWAGLPMPKAMQGHKRRVNAGQSYYAGDGRNAATVSIEEVRAAFGKLGAAREEERVRQVNPQSRGMQGPTAPGAVGTGNGQQVSTTGSRNLGSDAKNTASAASSPKVATAPMAKSDDSNLMASAAQLPTKSLAPSVMQDPDPDNEGYGNNLAIVASPAGKVSPQMPRQTGGGGFVVMDQDPGLTIGGIINARLYNA
jgi:hypothetical protein